MTTNTRLDRDERCALLDEALSHLIAAREALDAAGLLHEPSFRAYHAAQLEGDDGGWLGGPWLIDVVREAFDAAERGEFDDDESDVEPCSDCGQPVRYSDESGYQHVDPSASPSCFLNWDQQGRPAVVGESALVAHDDGTIERPKAVQS
jgi:hypothetical protein